MQKILKNKVVLITRPFSEHEEAEKHLATHGAEVINFPTNKISAVELSKDDLDLVRNWRDFNYLIFSSANAVQIFHDLTIRNNSFSKTRKAKLIALGSKTAKQCERLNIDVDIVPAEYSANGVVADLANRNISGKKILIPCSAISRDEMKVGLGNLGADVTVVFTYTIVTTPVEELAEKINTIKMIVPDVFVFTSPSTFNNFLNILKVENPITYFEKRCIAAIGPTTKKAIEKLGVAVTLTPEKFTMEEVAELIISYYKNK